MYWKKANIRKAKILKGSIKVYLSTSLKNFNSVSHSALFHFSFPWCYINWPLRELADKENRRNSADSLLLFGWQNWLVTWLLSVVLPIASIGVWSVCRLNVSFLGSRLNPPVGQITLIRRGINSMSELQWEIIFFIFMSYRFKKRLTFVRLLAWFPTQLFYVRSP